jgi:predicted lipid-binding transport protein (Tim44 family)
MRLGGGKSMGSQRQAQPMEPRQPQAAPQAAPQQPGAAAAPAAAAGGSRWMGPVAGLLAGGLLGAMLFGGAFDGIKFMDILIILLLAGGIFFIFRMLARKSQAAAPRSEPLQYAGAGADAHRPAPSMPPPPPAAAAAPAAAQPAGNYFPAGFDPEGFAQGAKSNFLRLQEANDRGDLTSLRDMMTPALYREVEAEIRERGAATQKTEVVTLDAKVIEVVTEGNHYVASVRFTGLIKEDGGQPESFSEVWHLEKPLDGKSGWLMSGIQQD